MRICVLATTEDFKEAIAVFKENLLSEGGEHIGYIPNRDTAINPETGEGVPKEAMPFNSG